MTAPGSSVQATVQAVLDFANLDRDFADHLLQSTRNAERVVNRNLAGITRAAQGTQADINRAFDRITMHIDTRGATQDFNQIERAAQQSARGVEHATDDMADHAEEAGGATEKLKDKFKELAAGAAGLLAIGGIMETVGEAIERNSMVNKLGAQLDLTKEESAQAGRIAGQVYAENYGESFEAVTEATGVVLSSLSSLGYDGGKSVEDLTKRILTFSDTFDTEAAEVAASAHSLVQQGLAQDAPEALDLLAASFQRVPAAMREELLPLIDEYGTFFTSLGFDGPEAMGLLANASHEGAIAMDKVGDALKETGIRATDLGDSGAVEALDAIGLGAADIQNRLLAGGASAKEAFGEMVAGLLAVTDPAEQAEAAIALFGTPLEDLNKAEIPVFLESLTGAGETMEGFGGTIDRMGERLEQGPGAHLELLRRQIQDTLINGLGQAAGYVQQHTETFKVLAIAVGAAAAVYGVLRLAAVASAVQMGVHAAATGADTAALAANRIAMGAHAVTAAVMRAGMLAGAAATGIATAATWAFNAAMAVLTSPITLIIVAIAALVAGIVLLYNKNETFRNFVQAAWAAIQQAVSVTWEFLKVVFAGIASWVTETLIPNLQNFWNIAKSVFEGIANVVSFWWNDVVMPIFHDVQLLFSAVIIPLFLGLWHNVFEPMFQSIGTLISFWWTNIVQPAFDGLKLAVGLVGDALSAWWTGVVTPVFEGAKSAIGLWWDFAQGVFEQVKNAIGLVGDAFSAAGHVMSSIWDTVLAAMRPAVHAIGSLLAKVPDKIGPVEIPGAGTAHNVGEALQKFRTGGLALGPGTGTSDSIMAFLSNGEFVTNAIATGKWLPLLHAINEGAGINDILALLLGGNYRSGLRTRFGLEEDNPLIASALGIGDALRGNYTGNLRALGIEEDNPIVDALLGAGNLARGNYTGNLRTFGLEEDNPLIAAILDMMPGFAAGGLVSPAQIKDFAKGIEGVDYAWGGWGNGWSTDCSGAASALANYATAGLPAGKGERAATGTMGQFLSGLGAQEGIGPKGSLSFGWFVGGPYGGHIAATLPTGDKIEMGGARGNGQFDGQALGADGPDFDKHMHFPPEFFIGGDLGGGAGLSPGAGAALSGGGTGGAGGFGGSGGTGGGSASGSGGVGGDLSADATRVFVTNWPGGASTSAAAGTGAGAGAAADMGAADSGAPTEFGIDAANQWAASQDFPGQARDWAADALKEIFGQVSEPFGVKSLTDKAVDDLKTAAQALADARANQAQPLVGVMNINGTGDPQAVGSAVVDQLAERMGAVTGRYRNGG